MTDQEVSALRHGDLVHLETPAGCVKLRITAGAFAPGVMAQLRSHIAFGTNDRKTIVYKVTHRGRFHLPRDHRRLKARMARVK